MPGRRCTVAIVALAGSLAFAVTPVHAQTEGEYLYKVVMLQAVPGGFNDLIEALEESFEITEMTGDRRPFWLRHSQGDRWDFMILYPMGDFTAYHATDRVRRRRAVWNGRGVRGLRERIRALTASEEEWFARSIPVEPMAARFDGAGLFHIEMFAGIAGRRAELLEQRRMENRYYEHLGRRQNVLFVKAAGPDWDAMTVGFYEDLQAFAGAGAQHSAEAQEEAARAAGFEGLSAIGPYLRSLIRYHNDTLGVPVR